jgi:hypothetical protein
MTLDDALLWLNDRLGKSVGVWIAREYPDFAVMVFAAAGELRHWTEDKPDTLEWTGVLGPLLDELHGHYYIADSIELNLSAVQPLDVNTDPEDGRLIVRLDECTTLNVIDHEKQL